MMVVSMMAATLSGVPFSFFPWLILGILTGMFGNKLT